MKRDMDLIRMLLIRQETGEPPPGLADYPEPLIVYNVALMKDAGLIEAAIAKGPDGTPMGAVIIRMTWAGHDFLDAARNDTVWRTAREKILKPGVSWTFELLKETLKALATQQLSRMGLPGFEQ
jgi:Hypothetical protein (DUF2513)